ncbi:aminotransferase class I/II-fold pyridoxal phosphate-dependent enzyme (plasmid) [Mesorhizobium sp. B2-1-8]|uniref:aminotransferase class I/II-fold pyridoxal phosphate-dependent enzyme n=1 Tax=Mesorhizobium sp. B2-1-8 TaxID=2589967 RepID=UPI00112E26D2|nr:aminotransferase class I/II-fold pyridoxal phosphate-dependent enzyme [Mesorhizobium sp. B2-1-8]UCI22810.1 aminotransferase class I/II-fold pyridoxal phosphate-dependent enzyme [Mesorhizobium sp. B2-1-8]
MSSVSGLPAMALPWAPARVQERVKAISEAIPIESPAQLFEYLSHATELAIRTYEKSAGLYAGANVLTSYSIRLSSAELSSRPTLGLPGEKFPAGASLLDALEIAATDAVRTVMNASFADVRMPTATMANLAVLVALTEPGDTIAALPEPAGGHVSHRSGAPRVRGLRVATVPYDYQKFDVDLDALPAFLEKETPRLLILGGSMMLRAHDVPAISRIARHHGVRIMYDASHVAGLIAGGRFQKPLEEGADVLTFSTYKSFGGPAGGVICTNDVELAEELSNIAYPTLTANYDASRLGPLAMAASELLAHGAEYADKCIAHARSLGQYLTEEGLSVVGHSQGFTDTHHLALDVREFGGGHLASEKLATAGMIVSPSLLPISNDENKWHGLRIGTQELTRRGLSEAGYRRLAQLMAGVLNDGIELADAAASVAGLVK